MLVRQKKFYFSELVSINFVQSFSNCLIVGVKSLPVEPFLEFEVRKELPGAKTEKYIEPGAIF